MDKYKWKIILVCPKIILILDFIEDIDFSELLFNNIFFFFVYSEFDIDPSLDEFKELNEDSFMRPLHGDENVVSDVIDRRLHISIIHKWTSYW